MVWADRLCCASYAQGLSLVDVLVFHITPCLNQTVGIPHFHMAVIPAMVRTVHFRKRFYPSHVFVGQAILLAECLSFDFTFLSNKTR